MFLKKLTLKNWKNFQECRLELGARLFIVGPNASGKSNLLDAIKFLRDLAKEGGGLQTAVQDRGGLSKIRCLSARRDPQVEITAEFVEDLNKVQSNWTYSISITQEPRGHHRPILKHEKVWCEGELIFNRPDEDDKKDKERLTQTGLEQINANKKFRDVAKYLSSVRYLHIVPQLIKHSKLYTGPGVSGDPFGRHFLDKIAESSEKMKKSRLKKIEKALKNAVPNLKEFTFTQDRQGSPHLEVVYKHWRSGGAGKQQEDQLSDGTLRLIGFLWALLESDSLLLLEEPELSLHSGVIQQLSALMFRVLKNKRQIMITTHSPDLLNDKGIGPKEIAVVKPQSEGSIVQTAVDMPAIHDLMKSGFTAADAVIPGTSPRGIDQLPFSFTD